MRSVEPGEAARALEARFPADLPARQRLLGVIDGDLAGAIRADDADPPAWVTITELSDGTTYVAEARGLSPWWNANAENVPSLRAARTLGFRDERAYDLAWWSIDAFR